MLDCNKLTFSMNGCEMGSNFAISLSNFDQSASHPFSTGLDLLGGFYRS